MLIILESKKSEWVLTITVFLDIEIENAAIDFK